MRPPWGRRRQRSRFRRGRSPFVVQSEFDDDSDDDYRRHEKGQPFEWQGIACSRRRVMLIDKPYENAFVEIGCQISRIVAASTGWKRGFETTSDMGN